MVTGSAGYPASWGSADAALAPAHKITRAHLATIRAAAYFSSLGSQPIQVALTGAWPSALVVLTSRCRLAVPGHRSRR